MTERTELLNRFLQHHGMDTEVAWLPADASSRRYGRVDYQGRNCVLMDAPPNPATRTPEFIAIAGFLREQGLTAPEIYCSDVRHGFIVLEDLGRDLFSSYPASKKLYDLAYRCIEALQARVPEDPKIAPAFDTVVMTQELRLFRDWYIPAAGIVLSDAVWQEFDVLVQKYQAQVAALPQRFVLRDCHVDNFLYRPQQTGLAQCGILDFQDGGWGSALYDVTSLVFDARRDVPEVIQEAILRRHAKFLQVSWRDYAPAAYYLVLQRALKVLGIFTRLNVRDGKGSYLAHLERCWRQIGQSCRDLPDWQAWMSAHLATEKPALYPMLPVDTAMLLAAGQGTRMGALGRTTPKPLLEVAGKSIIKRGEANMRKAGVSRFIVNAHHCSEQVVRHFQGHEDTQVIVEAERLETGGGVRNALGRIKRDLFWVVNGDSLLQGEDLAGQVHDAISNIIRRNAEIVRYADCGFGLLLLVAKADWKGADFKADFTFCADGVLRRAVDDRGYGYSGVMLLHRAAIASEPIEFFSLNRVFDRLMARQRLFGVVLRGQFYHVGTPEALEQANTVFQEQSL